MWYAYFVGCNEQILTGTEILNQTSFLDRIAVKGIVKQSSIRMLEIIDRKSVV